MSTTLKTDITDLTDLVRESLGDPYAEIAEQRVEKIGHPGALSTAGLHRVSGTTTAGRRWSFVAKSIHSVRHWPMIGMLPDGMREQTIAHFPWRADLDVYLEAAPLPEGLRLPRLHRVDDLGDDRLVLWLEDVREIPGAWDLDRYRAAARLLGRLAAMNRVTPAGDPASSRQRNRAPDLAPSHHQRDPAPDHRQPGPAPDPAPDHPRRGLAAGCGLPSSPGRPLSPSLRGYCEGPVLNLMLPGLRDPATWAHPLVAAYTDAALRDDLLALGERMDWLLETVNRLPHTLGHGDASPQNLLVPADGSAEFVAIDWSWPGPLPIGLDLGQLLVGLANAGAMEPAELPAIHAAIEPAYAAEVDADPAIVRFGYIASLVLRSAWCALPLERLSEKPTPELHELFRKRAGLARFITHLGRTHFL